MSTHTRTLLVRTSWGVFAFLAVAPAEAMAILPRLIHRRTFTREVQLGLVRMEVADLEIIRNDCPIMHESAK
jgi:hypothetical protein